MIDLHIHSSVTTPGDGGDSTPSEIVIKASEIGLSAIALTDHDSVKGIPEAVQEAKKQNLKFVPGVEIACNFHDLEIEIISLGIDFEIMNGYLFKSDEQILQKKQDFINRSKIRCAELGLEFPEIIIKQEDLHIDELHEVVSKTFAIPNNKETCKTITGVSPETEDGYYKALFAPGKPCRVIKDTRSLKEAIDKTHSSGGKSFLAHPKRADGVLANLSNDFIEETLTIGLDGIECIHSKMMPKDSAMLIDFCKQRNLLMTGGSDTHALETLEKWNNRIQVPDNFIDWYFSSK